MAHNRLPHFQFYPQDYLWDPVVLAMTPEAEGLYIRLLANAWLLPEPGVIPAHLVPMLAAAHRVPEERREAALAQVSAAFGRREDGAWVQRRMVIEHKLAQEVASKSRRAAETRWEKVRRLKQIDAGALRSQCRSNAIGEGRGERGDVEEESTSTTLPIFDGRLEVIAKKDPKAEWLEAFEQDFYPAYPRKVKPDDARKAWLQMKPWDVSTLEAICSGLDRWVVYWKEHETPRDRIPYPATFLRSGAWRGEAG